MFSSQRIHSTCIPRVYLLFIQARSSSLHGTQYPLYWSLIPSLGPWWAEGARIKIRHQTEDWMWNLLQASPSLLNSLAPGTPMTLSLWFSGVSYLLQHTNNIIKPRTKCHSLLKSSHVYDALDFPDKTGFSKEIKLGAHHSIYCKICCCCFGKHLYK